MSSTWHFTYDAEPDKVAGQLGYSEHFIGGTALAVFLMPDNYHQYYAPVSGVVVESKENAGDRLFGRPDMLGMVNEGNPGYGQDYSVHQGESSILPPPHPHRVIRLALGTRSACL